MTIIEEKRKEIIDQLEEMVRTVRELCEIGGMDSDNYTELMFNVLKIRSIVKNQDYEDYIMAMMDILLES